MLLSKETKERTFLLGLHLYLRSLQLSIDRTLPREWRQLRDYISERVPVRKVLSLIEPLYRADNLGNLESPPSKPKTKNLKSSKLFKLNQSDWNFILFWLKKVDSLLAQDEPVVAEVSDARLHLAYCEEITRPINGEADGLYTNVEHFNQNPFLECEAIEELIGAAWPPE